ncbi:hypothetical protein L1987_39646 [Smallanthus sonchifolius]|uniref:Uncharacterized protein n=1 Tax=Smallanthus sonchifolius TaxID=185202 RepID=A0ACB9HM07_9ASTR|nr:hypothetical protein L1987_39646 [Smallanthus sonchifolius]
MDSKIHPALTVSNIKSFIPITLAIDSGKFSSWSELFRIHCRAFLVFDHISSPKPTDTTSSSATPAEGDKATPPPPPPPSASWDRIDAIVLQWIYGTISEDLLDTILKPDTTAYAAWTTLCNHFQDNKITRAVQLKQKFVNTRLDDFPNPSAYCQALKILADQLANVDAPVDNDSLVIQLILGLNEQYEGIATILQQMKPLPAFTEARSKLLMEETRKAAQTLATANSASHALHAAGQGGTAGQVHNAPPPRHDSNTTGYSDRFRGRGRSYGRGKGRSSRGKARGTPNFFQNPHSPSFGPPQYPQFWSGPISQIQNWANNPPCPYPTVARPNNQAGPQGSNPGILGPRPSHAFHTGYVPTDIDQALYTMSLNPPDHNWYMDTGATTHMTNYPGNFQSFFNNGILRNIIVGNGTTIPVNGQGNQNLQPPFPPLKLNDVLLAPKLIKNLLSVRRLTTDNWISIEFDPFGFLVKDFKTRIPILRSNSSGDLYPLLATSDTHATSPSTFAAISHQLWHQRLGHPGPSLLHSLKNSCSIDYGKINKNICQSCVFGKSTRLPFIDSHTITSLPFDIIHSDLWTSPVLSSGGHRYYILFLDDKTNFLWTYPLSNKSNVYKTFCAFYNYIHTQFERKIKNFQCDNGREYANSSFQQFCHQNGMSFRFSCPHTSSQNGKAERKIRSINNVIRTLLAHAQLPNTYWHHALEMATYILNILPSKNHRYHNPTQLLYNQTPSYDHLRVFGCLCYPILPATTIHKLESRSNPCVFLGYPSHHRGYKCLDLKTHKLIISRHVVFDETIFPFTQITKPTPSYDYLTETIHPLYWAHIQNNPSTNPSNTHNQNQNTHPNIQSPSHIHSTPSAQSSSSIAQIHTPIFETQDPTSSAQNNSPAQPSPSTSQSLSSSPNTPPISHSIPTAPTNLQPPVRSIRTRAMDGITRPKQLFNLNSTTIVPIPKNPSVALSTPEWHNAMTTEFNALIKNRTWELVPCEPNMNIIRSMWLFKHKFNSNGSLERYKARLVCDGRSQQVGVDCGETFSPVVKPATIRTVLSIAMSKSWPVHQLDVTNAFLHGHLNETVYMYQPMGFRHRDYPDHICRLNKSLYGLKQAPRAWYQRFTDYVLTMGFMQSRCDNSLFILHHGADTAYLLLYVDDIVLATSSDDLRQQLMLKLASEFAMKDLGPLSFFLGISVKRQKDTLFLSQQTYVNEIVQRAGLESCNSVTTPVDTHTKLSASSGTEFENPTLYRSLAGALQYLTFTRPDISYAVQQVCMHMHAPRTDHWNALKRIIRYIKGTSDMGLTITQTSIPSLIAYTDADWAGCPDTRRSTSGYCVYYGDNLLSWSSKRQPTISRSSAEAEYRGVANVVAEVCWLRNLLLELRHQLPRATIVYCDNVSAIYLSGNPVQHQRTKHIELDIHFVREHVQRGTIRVLHVPSRYQIADIFTKGLPRILFEDFRSSLSLRSPPAKTAGV